ncbi:C40 family peptidase [Bordetella holmesii]|uniref:C40 family peptidase n=1 Tax=Bordetella holmesii TaxID=35814 RepID=UPI00046C8D9B|nr:C40 family peptidase [Bordetella holmesii]AMD46961.1 NlpC/P60 family protein 2 [Bordetella holmesii H558]AMD47656.1 NlpC/P60 family protein 2 [Bordetella holmesii F627]AOB35859.1 NlpC/P60 family protein 2 [Bordetella holmesii]AUL19832.1 NlpC/P60 family protein 2 [Bordetella holmesii]AUL23172.1 NlpC/P60 family protein 2 [Bordetella holmesii]
MTPPTRKDRGQWSRLSALLSAPLLALCLTGIASATVHTDVLGNIQGLKLADETTVPTLRERIVQAGLDKIGTPYSWGGDDPVDGFDCSGLALFVFRETAGIDLPRTSRAQRQAGDNVNRRQLRPGDLVFFATSRRGVTSHVGIYIGQNQFVHAPSRGAKVRVDKLSNSYWSKRYVGARSYLESNPSQLLAQNAN